MSRLVSSGIDLPRAPDAVLDAIDRLVLVVPHPDDEALSSGLLLAQACRRNLRVQVIAASDGEAAYPGNEPELLAALRRHEQTAAFAQLGVAPDRVERLGLPDGRLGAHADHLAAAIAAHLPIDGTTLLVAPSIHDWHPDHEACGHAASLALRSHPAPDRITHWSSVFWAHHHPERLLTSRPLLVRLTGSDDDVARRHRAVECHRSQFEHEDLPPILRDELIAHLAADFEIYVQERP